MLVHQLEVMCLSAIQWYEHINVLSSCYNIDLATTFVIHLNEAIMRHGTYYETPTKICSFPFE